MPESMNTPPTYAMAGNERRTRIVVVITLVTMVVELAVGRWTGSMALWADGWHMASHAGALGLTLFGYAYARKHATNPRFTFGVGKVFSLVGFGSAIALSLVSLEMVGESAARLVTPVDIDFDQALPVAVVGLVVNLVCAAILMKDESQTGGGHSHHDHGHGHGHGHAHGASGDGDHNLRAAFLHVVADALTSVAAIGALLGGRALGWNALDPIMGLVGGALVARWGLTLVRDTARVLLDEKLDELHAKTLDAVGSLDAVDAPCVRLWQLGPGAVACAVTVTSERTTTADVLGSLESVHDFAWTHCMILPPASSTADHNHHHEHHHAHGDDHASGGAPSGVEKNTVDL
jgi:cation diffusion facilitator family transporter